MSLKIVINNRRVLEDELRVVKAELGRFAYEYGAGKRSAAETAVLVDLIILSCESLLEVVEARAGDVAL